MLYQIDNETKRIPAITAHKPVKRMNEDRVIKNTPPFGPILDFIPYESYVAQPLAGVALICLAITFGMKMLRQGFNFIIT
jgi:hypothetical protein